MVNSQSNKTSDLRIIGGSHRSRKVTFPVVEGLRPTPNRVRETLFNWLTPYIQGAKCLDMFAGSGILSFEALSRGANYSLLLDSSKNIIDSLVANKEKLNFSSLDIVHSTFPYPFSIINEHFDIIFLDPPFHQGYIPRAIDWLLKSHVLKPNTLIYIESEQEEDVINLPEGWKIIKDKKAGNVRYSLIVITL